MVSGAIKPLRTVLAPWRPAFPIPSRSNTRTRVTHIMTGALRQFPDDRSLIIEVNDTADERDSPSSCFRGSRGNERVHGGDEPAERLPVFALEALRLAHMLRVSVANLEHGARTVAKNLMRSIRRAAWRSRCTCQVVRGPDSLWRVFVFNSPGFLQQRPSSADLLTYYLQSKLLRIEIAPWLQDGFPLNVLCISVSQYYYCLPIFFCAYHQIDL